MKSSFGPPFTAEERKLAVKLYSDAHSLAEVARKLGRSPAGVYKVLRAAGQPIRTNKKVDLDLKREIAKLYFRFALSTVDIAKLLGISKTTVRYWLRNSENPLHWATRLLAGSCRVRIISGEIDLLPFVKPHHLRWVNEEMILMKKGDSKTAAVTRYANAPAFFRLVGFYLAEGNKTAFSAEVVNTNSALIILYRDLARRFVRSGIFVREIPSRGTRVAQEILRLGGICMKCFLLNAISGILNYLSREASQSTEVRNLGLDFLNGESDGDGSVARSRQQSSRKQRVALRITEQKLDYANRLLTAIRQVLGVGSLYKPKGRNYFEVVASLSPPNAALLFIRGFFSEHAESRRRLARKALDSVSLRRYVSLYAHYGAGRFSFRSLVGLGIPSSFIARSVLHREMTPVGVDVTAESDSSHWYRFYVLSDEIQILARGLVQYAQANGC